jgi:hypothetical protein
MNYLCQVFNDCKIIPHGLRFLCLRFVEAVVWNSTVTLDTSLAFQTVGSEISMFVSKS